MRQRERVAELRRRLPAGAIVQDYTFEEGPINLGDGDPSLAYGQSGNFYLAGISIRCLPAHANGPNGYDCTGILRSTDNGQTFPFLSNAVACPRNNPNPPPNLANRCFPDQEHIAADGFNAAPGGDQVYSVWRNFDATDQDPAIVCSQDSGATWTAPADVDSGFIPRVGAGQDGFVYVVYRSGGNIRINKYSSCANGLVVQPTFPKTIGAVTDVTCPVPGLDRCNDGNNLSSITVAVDDTNPAHVYVAYANETAAGNQDIIVQDSLDGGVTWPAARVVTVNAAVTGVRFMPWVCATGGDAYVTWYDRRASTASNNDLTDYYAGIAGLDGMGNLTVRSETRITASSDPQCASGWPCAPRATGDSESCSVQPQLAGVCCDATMTGCPGSGQRCDFTSGPACPNPGETCNGGGGCPKYGDYNGNACASLRLLTGWASATPPSGIPSSGGIDVFFAEFSNCTLTCPANITVDNDPNLCGAVVSYPAPTAIGSCGTVTCSPASGSFFPVGQTAVQCTTTSGDTCSFSATVNDVQPPSVTDVSVDQPYLWPPNHKMREVTVSYTENDNCPGSTCELGVASNEPVDGLGDGDTTPDWIIEDAHHEQLRAERSGTGDGRTYTTTITCTDASGNASTAQASVQVKHDMDAPASGSLFAVGAPVNFSGHFLDLPGIQHTAQWVFDGAAQAGTIVEPTAGVPGSVTGTYSFASTGVYAVRMDVSDSSGQTGSADAVGQVNAEVVIYQPSGGYAAGGGWLDSPAGAYAGDPTLAGKVNYAFVSRYYKNATKSTGETELDFRLAKFRFNALNFDIQTISGGRAKYRGSGRVNGSGGYRFLLNVLDGQTGGGTGPDKIRIKIWNKATGAVVYDTQMGAPDGAEPTMVVGEGSSIVIQQ